MESPTPLMEMVGVSKSFGTGSAPTRVLENVSLEIHAGEIVALLGKSGSGKSTLLRCLSGLIPTDDGEVRYRGEPLAGTNPGTAMVFQSFALLPWLTVRENVELGLEAKGYIPAERRVMAERAIDLVGLDGFEDAYPRELSGGMRQRVGFARALVVNPDVLLMDEPFSALDVFTAENLRGELLELWSGEEFPIRSIVIVTHNIEEAVQLADRVLVLGSHPGRIIFELPIGTQRPRDRTSPEFGALVETVYDALTQQQVDGPTTASRATGVGEGDEQPEPLPTPGSHPLPLARVDALSGFAEILVGTGPLPLGELATELGLESRDLLPLVEALEMLGYAEMSAGRVSLTEAGDEFARADIQDSKRLFSEAVLERAPLVRVIVNALERAPRSTLRRGFFADILRHSLSAVETDRQLDVAIDWGRYAEQYTYDADHDEFIADPDREAVGAPAAT